MAEFRSTDLEKSTAQHIDRTYSDDSKDTDKAEQDARINALTPEEQKKLLRKIDIRLVGILGLMYCVSLMDRTNLGIAVVGGMGVDMMLIGNRYSIITLVFFVTYVLLQPPATVILRKVGPRSFLPAIVILWGITVLGFAFVTNWIQLIPLRLVLGVFEAGFFPGAAYLLSCWYCRYDLQKRNAVFYLIGSMSSAFSGIMSYGFYKMGGLGDLGPRYGQHYYPTKTNPARGILPGIAGWRWIFIMQGLITIVIGFLGIVYIADFPEKAAKKSKSLALKFITEKEAAYIVAKIELDRKDAIAEPFNFRKYAMGALDLKVWAFAFLFGLTTITSYSIAFFLPIILKDGMGFDVARSQCLIAPPYVCAAIWMYICAVLCDKYRLRGPFIIFNAVLGLIGLPLLGFAKGNAVRYFGVFLATTSCNANIPCVMTYQANNIRGQWKRALVSATLVGAGGIGGIIGSLVFRKQDSPGYKPGIYTTMIAAGLTIIIVLLLDLKFWFANKRAANGGKPIEGLVGFRYTL